MTADDTTTEAEREADFLADTTIDHPAGTGMGVAGGAIAGAAAGSVAGPVGVGAGAVVGAVIGGAAGHATAAAISPTEEELYWSHNHPSQLYASGGAGSGLDFEEYRPAYRLGIHGPGRFAGDFDSAESQLESEWEEARGDSRLDWQHARPAVRAAWERVSSRRRPGVDIAPPANAGGKEPDIVPSGT